jgi:hypothetical protein
MTTTTAEMARPALARPPWTRLLAPLGGIGLVAGLVGIFVSPASDDTGETPREVVAYATSHEGWTIAILLFGLLSIGLGAAFVAGLHARLRSVATATETGLVMIGGTAFILCSTLCWTLWTAPLADMPDEPARALAQAEAYLGYDDVGWFLLGASGIAAAVMAVPASLAAMRAGVPAWLGWLGVAAGVASLATVAFFGMFAWIAWIAVASIVMLVARGE